MIKPLLELTHTPKVDMEYTVARQFLGARMKDTAPPDRGHWTMAIGQKTCNCCIINIHSWVFLMDSFLFLLQFKIGYLLSL